MSHSIHDFSAKLRQPALLPALRAYVEWRRALRDARSRGEPDPAPPARLAPLSINLDLTTACNYRCTHCIDWDILNSRWKHDERVLRDSLEVMARRGMRSVILIGGGEPTVHPRFAEFVAWLKELELQVAIVSNGSRGDRLLEIASLLDERDWIRLSLDSGSNELFRAMHRPVDPKLDLDAICRWIPEIKSTNPAPRLGFSFIITWAGAEREAGTPVLENVHEIALAAERARRFGFDYLSVKPFLERTPEGAEVLDPSDAASGLAATLARIRAEVEKARTFEDARFKVYVSTNLRALETGEWRDYTRQPRVCHVQALRQVLTPTGLYNCPAHRGVERAKIAGPDAFKSDASGEETSARLGGLLDRFDASHECREVTCIYNGVNWWIDELVAGDGEILPAPESEDYFL